MSESDLVRAVLQALTLRRVWAWRVNSGVTVIGSGKSKRVIRGAPAGSPDIMLVVPGTLGRLGAVELKTETGRLRASQQRWHDKASRMGVACGVARSVGEAMALVDLWSPLRRTA